MTKAEQTEIKFQSSVFPANATEHVFKAGKVSL